MHEQHNLKTKQSQVENFGALRYERSREVAAHGRILTQRHEATNAEVAMNEGDRPLVRGPSAGAGRGRLSVAWRGGAVVGLSGGFVMGAGRCGANAAAFGLVARPPPGEPPRCDASCHAYFQNSLSERAAAGGRIQTAGTAGKPKHEPPGTKPPQSATNCPKPAQTRPPNKVGRDAADAAFNPVEPASVEYL